MPCGGTPLDIGYIDHAYAWDEEKYQEHLAACPKCRSWARGRPVTDWQSTAHCPQGCDRTPLDIGYIDHAYVFHGEKLKEHLTVCPKCNNCHKEAYCKIFATVRMPCGRTPVEIGYIDAATCAWNQEKYQEHREACPKCRSSIIGEPPWLP
jgi:ribosomal protein S27AE